MTQKPPAKKSSPGRKRAWWHAPPVLRSAQGACRPSERRPGGFDSRCKVRGVHGTWTLGCTGRPGISSVRSPANERGRRPSGKAMRVGVRGPAQARRAHDVPTAARAPIDDYSLIAPRIMALMVNKPGESLPATKVEPGRSDSECRVVLGSGAGRGDIFSPRTDRPGPMSHVFAAQVCSRRKDCRRRLRGNPGARHRNPGVRAPQRGVEHERMPRFTASYA